MLVPHDRDVDSSAPPGGAPWYCTRRGLVSTDQTSASLTDAQLELDYIKVSLSFWRLWLKCHICWMPDVETTAQDWAHRGTLDPFLQTIFFFIWSCWFWGNLQRSYSLSWSLKLLTEISVLPVSSGSTFIQSLSAVSHSRRKPENSTFFFFFGSFLRCLLLLL